MDDEALHEERQAAIIRHLNRPGYGHAGNLLIRMRQLEQIMNPVLAVEALHSEIMHEE